MDRVFKPRKGFFSLLKFRVYALDKCVRSGGVISRTKSDTKTKILSMLGTGYFLKINSQQEKPMFPECRTAVLHDIPVLSKNRVYLPASILTVQWLAYALHEIVTFLNL